MASSAGCVLFLADFFLSIDTISRIVSCPHFNDRINQCTCQAFDKFNFYVIIAMLVGKVADCSILLAAVFLCWNYVARISGCSKQSSESLFHPHSALVFLFGLLQACKDTPCPPIETQHILFSRISNLLPIACPIGYDDASIQFGLKNLRSNLLTWPSCRRKGATTSVQPNVPSLLMLPSKAISLSPVMLPFSNSQLKVGTSKVPWSVMVGTIGNGVSCPQQMLPLRQIEAPILCPAS